MSRLQLDQLPEVVLLCILRHCQAVDLAACGSTCTLFNRLTKDDLLWRERCWKDFKIPIAVLDDGVTVSYRSLYTNLLHKYGHMMGLYQSQVGPVGGLLEIRFCGGKIEGVWWEPTSNQDVCAPLAEYLCFSVDENKSNPQCLPGPQAHSCTLTIDKWRGTVVQRCHDTTLHSNDLSGMDYIHLNLDPRKLRFIFLNVEIGRGVNHKPLLLPSCSSVPRSLLATGGSLLHQVITPGLFQGSYSVHGLEIILFKYKDENELWGYKVTGDINVYAGKVTVKLLLKYPVSPTKEEQISLEALSEMEPSRTQNSIDKIAKQPFFLPEKCHVDTNTPIPSHTLARYHGFGQIAYEWYQRPSFTPVQVMIFNNDLVGVLWLKMQAFSLFSRLKKKFTSNLLQNIEVEV